MHKKCSLRKNFHCILKYSNKNIYISKPTNTKQPLHIDMNNLKTSNYDNTCIRQ